VAKFTCSVHHALLYNVDDSDDAFYSHLAGSVSSTDDDEPFVDPTAPPPDGNIG
jgi:hypothetical protein